MTGTRRLAAALLLLGSAAALPGCFFARTCIPMDAKGMELPIAWASDCYADQVARTSARVEEFPDDLARHRAECWRNLTVYPGE